MSYEIKFDNLPAGVALNSARDGDMVQVQSIGFFSEEDGDSLIDQLEGIGSGILAKLPSEAEIYPGKIHQLLAIIRRDRSATVYVNELKAVGEVQVKRDLKSGETVYTDDIADMQRLEFEGVAIPNDAGVLFVFSVGWRRALFFDFNPLVPKDKGGKDREYDIAAQLGHLYAYLLFQRRFKITEKQWQTLLQGQWFPFISLKEETIRMLVSYAANQWPLDDSTNTIAQELKVALPYMLARWKGTLSFAQHIPFFEKAVGHFTNNDYISATAILYPRIEGLLRSNQQEADSTAPASQKGLSQSATKKAQLERHAHSPILPQKFREYLEQVYFAAFDPNAPKIKVSRNSIGHGVASAEECSLKSAMIGLLIVDQLYYCFSDSTRSKAVASQI